MKKPDFVDVIEYVRTGEEDPAMEETLRLSPDGQELLKQARFICAVLQHQSTQAGEGDSAGAFANLGASARVMDNSVEILSSDISFGDIPEFERPVMLRRREESTSSILRRIEYADSGYEELGTLEIAAKGKMVFASYQPSQAVVMRYKKQSELSWLSQDDGENIVIQGQDVTLTFANRWAVGEPAKILVILGFKRTPARHFKLLFMPDTGPFQQIETDRDGIAELPAPDQSGLLRIETPIPQLLHIDYKK